MSDMIPGMSGVPIPREKGDPDDQHPKHDIVPGLYFCARVALLCGIALPTIAVYGMNPIAYAGLGLVVSGAGRSAGMFSRLIKNSERKKTDLPPLTPKEYARTLPLWVRPFYSTTRAANHAYNYTLGWFISGAFSPTRQRQIFSFQKDPTL